MPPLHEGSLEIMLTVPLSLPGLQMSFFNLNSITFWFLVKQSLNLFFKTVFFSNTDKKV